MHHRRAQIGRPRQHARFELVEDRADQLLPLGLQMRHERPDRRRLRQVPNEGAMGCRVVKEEQRGRHLGGGDTHLAQEVGRRDNAAHQARRLEGQKPHGVLAYRAARERRRRERDQPAVHVRERARAPDTRRAHGGHRLVLALDEARIEGFDAVVHLEDEVEGATVGGVRVGRVSELWPIVRRAKIKVAVVVAVEVLERAGNHRQTVELLCELDGARVLDNRLLVLSRLLVIERR